MRNLANQIIAFFWNIFAAKKPLNDLKEVKSDTVVSFKKYKDQNIKERQQQDVEKQREEDKKTDHNPWLD